MAGVDHDLVLAGGGLAGGLVALAFRHLRPEVDVAIVEQGPTIGGNHLWSFFDSDVNAGDRWLVDPLVAHRWTDNEVCFPDHARVLSNGYNTILSENLHARVTDRLPAGNTYLSAPIARLDTTSVTLADGRVLRAGTVLDARGAGDLSLLDLGWQKFFGQELLIEGGHGLARPIIMDARVPQIDGYRFIYLLPFSPDRLFVEDTYYSDGPEIDADVLKARIAEYVGARGWTVAGVAREEAGALPVALGGDIAAYLASGGPAPKLGVRAGLFHPTTGYSLPDAVRTAVELARLPDISAAAIARVMEAKARKLWRERGFYRLLDRMLFRAARPDQRYRILQRFYALDERLIERFYAARSSGYDRLRILTGKPPVPVMAALKTLYGGRG